MDIVQFAQHQEKQLGDYYQQLADLAPHTTIKELLVSLNQSESQHYTSLNKIQEGWIGRISNRFDLSHSASLLKKAEDQMDQWGMDFTELDQYQRIRDVELQLERFYLDRACETQNPLEHQFYQEMAQEEHRHYMIMDELCSLMARRITHIVRPHMEQRAQYVSMWY